MDKSKFVYTTYIATTPEKLWDALTQPEFTRQYWFETDIESDWKVGSPVLYRMPSGDVTLEGEVRECDPPRRLVYTFNPKFKNNSDQEPPSLVTMDLEQQATLVRLTITHDGFETESQVFQSIQTGWPWILSGLKSMLETGEPLPDPDKSK